MHKKLEVAVEVKTVEASSIDKKYGNQSVQHEITVTLTNEVSSKKRLFRSPREAEAYLLGLQDGPLMTSDAMVFIPPVLTSVKETHANTVLEPDPKIPPLALAHNEADLSWVQPYLNRARKQ